MKEKASNALSMLTLMAALAGLGPSAVCAQELSLTAFGDVNYGARFGSAANKTARDQFEAFGEERFLKSMHNGFGLVGTDFVLTADLPGDIVYLGEVNLQVARGSQTEFEVDVERMFLEKRFMPQFNLQGGLFFTPIGYFNRTLYSRAYLMNSIQVPDLFEEELGLVPTHTVGLQVNGQFELGHEHRVYYAASFGNGRPADPGQNVYARDDDGWRSATAMLEWFFPWANEGRLGLSGWFDEISSFYVARRGETRDARDPSTPKMKLYEVGLDVHFVLKTQWVNLLLEGVYQRHDDKRGNLPSAEDSSIVSGGIAELSLNVGPNGAIKPYVRYDRVKLPKNGDPYLELRSEGDAFTRFYVNQTNLLMLGTAWDAMSSVRVKLEYSIAFSGARDRHGVVAQTAFAF